MTNLDKAVNDAKTALEGAERDLSDVQRLAEASRTAKEIAEASYDKEPTPELGRTALAARQEAELAGVREERASRRAASAREVLDAARATLAAEIGRVEEERRKVALESAIRRASAATFRVEASEDIKRFLELEKERLAIAARLEARVEAAQEAAREARELGASTSPLDDRIGEGLLLHRLMVELPAGDATRERWIRGGAEISALFSAWHKKNESNASLSLYRGPLDHCHALAAAFPDIYRNAGNVLPNGCAIAMREVARFEAGSPMPSTEEAAS